MTRNRVAGHHRARQQNALPPSPAPVVEDLDAAQVAWHEHDAGAVEPGGHPYGVPCAYCLGRRPGDDIKRIRRQLALEAAERSGRDFTAVYSYGDGLPIRVLYLDNQPPPDLPTVTIDPDTGLVYAQRIDVDPETGAEHWYAVNINPPNAPTFSYEGA